ncbi:hypothetical protein [Microbacterium sp. PAMC21962]|uniref:hypothetical protein n=1 Tax=Microbacterium sp. PAMC21962 TaxID=2861280 RepID=UPI001C63AFDB|nr:hypothetical protein [Microbacterium sp. PAMC21962]QYF98486.1 hypothetical protein KY498_04365 [Microbacterium sp. PAMC21962]
MSGVEAPMVRNEHRAILGVDYRRTDMSPVTVPGWIAVEAVMPGDTVRFGRDELVVLSKLSRGAVMHLRARTTGGAEIVHEHAAGSYVEVTAVGAFDPEETPAGHSTDGRE